jgi:hypothetical protein
MAKSAHTTLNPRRGRHCLTALAVAFGALGPAAVHAADYPQMAPAEQYRMASTTDEIALARSAAPASISKDADILVLGQRGYEPAAKGSDGFVCMVLRGWTADFDDSVFWNPKIRGPICLNPAAVRTVLPIYLKRAEWAAAGVSKADMVERTKAAIAAKEIVEPQKGAKSYMMSKDGYLSDSGVSHWHPHLMLFLPRAPAATWGADLAGAPVMADTGALEPLTVLFVLVGHWSDGTPDAANMKM